MFDVFTSTPFAETSPDGADLLLHLQRAHTRMLSALNHEIRTPLTGILGMSDLLLESSLTDEQQEYVQLTRTCAESLLESLSNALEYTAIMAGQLDLCAAPIHLTEVISTSLSAMQARAEGRGVQIQLFTEPHEAGTSDIVIGDALRLRQVFAVLLSHAIDSCLQREITVAVSMFCADPGRKLILSVSIGDNGPDLPPARIAQMFDPPDTSVYTQARLELGLPLAFQLINAMGGSLEAESVPDAGTLLTITLPLQITESTHEPGVRTPNPLPHRPRILLVEDNDIAQRFMRTVMERKNYDVQVASSGEDAIVAMRTAEFDLVLMDVQMPGMDGLECTRHIRRLPGGRNVPIVACTANTAGEVRNSCIEAGMNDFLAKPVHTADLVDVVAKYVAAV